MRPHLTFMVVLVAAIAGVVSCSDDGSGTGLDAGLDSSPNDNSDGGPNDADPSGDSGLNGLLNGSTCSVDAECISGFCYPNASICSETACIDGFQNGNETAVDCGGDDCIACGANGAPCSGDTDCDSDYCSDINICRAPSCYDLVQNGNETGLDCGGSCDPCSPCIALAEQDDDYASMNHSANALIAGNAEIVMHQSGGGAPFRFDMDTQLSSPLTVTGVAAADLRVSGIADDGSVAGWYVDDSGASTLFRAVYWEGAQTEGQVLWPSKDAKAIATNTNLQLAFLEREAGAVTAKVVKLEQIMSGVQPSSTEYNVPVLSDCGYPRELRLSFDEPADSRALPLFITGMHGWDIGSSVIYSGGFWGSSAGSAWGIDLSTGNGIELATAQYPYARAIAIRRTTPSTNGLGLAASVVGSLGLDESSVQAVEWTLNPFGLGGASYTYSDFQFEIAISHSEARGINSSGKAVGVATPSTESEARAWIGDTTTSPPNNNESFLDGQIPVTFTSVPNVYGIDNNGNILAEAQKQSDGLLYYVVLKPLAIPSGNVLYEVIEIALKS